MLQVSFNPPPGQPEEPAGALRRGLVGRRRPKLARAPDWTGLVERILTGDPTGLEELYAGEIRQVAARLGGPARGWR